MEIKTQLINLGDNQAGTLRLKKKLDINYGSIRVEGENFIHYTRKGIDEIFHQDADKQKAKQIKATGEAAMIASGHIAVTPISEIESILH